MKRKTASRSPVEWMLGWLGFVLLVLLGWACDQQVDPSHAVRARLRRALARLVVPSVTATGWAIDHLAPIAARRTSTTQSTQPIRGHQ